MPDQDSAELPERQELADGALALMERHFNAVNAGDRGAFRDTAYLFDQVDGLPFQTWWTGMRSLAPLSVSMRPGTVGDRISAAHEPHVAIWIDVEATSEATGRSYRSNFVVWYLLRSRSWKLGCRMHWALEGA
jgi:hypothetical protein